MSEQNPGLHASIRHITRPPRIARLPLSARGYPVPWFVAWIEGVPDFRVIRHGAVTEAIRRSRCWICGEERGRYQAFVVGPMCVVNRISSEPPSHRECAEYAARACPFLTRPHMARRETGLPSSIVQPAGIPIDRNPGVAVLYVTRGFVIARAPRTGGPDGMLFRMQEPTEVLWYREGRTATRAEAMHSMSTGVLELQRIAEQEGPEAMAELAQSTLSAVKHLPQVQP
jgi:hypothetical protein